MTRPLCIPGKIKESLASCSKIGVTGAPGVGKTTFSRLLAAELAMPLYHTDDYIGRAGFSDVPNFIVSDFVGRERWILEGVQVARCLKRGLWPDALIVLTRAGWTPEPRHAGLSTVVERGVERWPGHVIRIDLDSLHEQS